MLKNKKTIGVLFSSRADCCLLQDFLIQKGYRVSILQPEKFIPQDLKDIDLIIAESSLARKLGFELLTLRK